MAKKYEEFIELYNSLKFSGTPVSSIVVRILSELLNVTELENTERLTVEKMLSYIQSLTSIEEKTEKQFDLDILDVMLESFEKLKADSLSEKMIHHMIQDIGSIYFNIKPSNVIIPSSEDVLFKKEEDKADSNWNIKFVETREGIMLARAIDYPAAKSIKHPNEETRLELEVRKLMREEGYVSSEALEKKKKEKNPNKKMKENMLLKEGNPGRSFSVLMPGFQLAGEVGFLIFQPDMTQFSLISSENANTDRGKKPIWISEPKLRQEEAEEKLNKMLEDSKKMRMENTNLNNEVIYHAAKYDAIFVSDHAIVQHLFYNETAILQARYMQKAYAFSHEARFQERKAGYMEEFKCDENGARIKFNEVHGWPELPIVKYSEKYNSLEEITKLSESEVENIWLGYYENYLRNQDLESLYKLSFQDARNHFSKFYVSDPFIFKGKEIEENDFVNLDMYETDDFMKNIEAKFLLKKEELIHSIENFVDEFKNAKNLFDKMKIFNYFLKVIKNETYDKIRNIYDEIKSNDPIKNLYIIFLLKQNNVNHNGMRGLDRFGGREKVNAALILWSVLEKENIHDIFEGQNGMISLDKIESVINKHLKISNISKHKTQLSHLGMFEKTHIDESQKAFYQQAKEALKHFRGTDLPLAPKDTSIIDDNHTGPSPHRPTHH